MRDLLKHIFRPVNNLERGLVVVALIILGIIIANI